MEIRIYETSSPSQQEVQKAAAEGYTHFMTVSADGKGSEEVVAACQENPWSSVALVHEDEFTDINIYPLFYLQHCSFYFPKEFFCKEAHAKLKLRDVPCVELSYEGNFVQRSEGLREKLYGILLETFFSFMKQLKLSDRPIHSAFSLSMGVFVACSPFYGLQTLLILILCPLLRLNVPLAILGSQISLPPIYALILPAELYVGFQLLGKQWSVEGEFLELAQTHFSAWFTGFLVVGSLLAGSIGIFWWLMQRKVSTPRKVNWTGHFRGGKKGIEFLIFLLKKLGLWAGYLFLYGIVPYYYLFAPRARKGLNQYWSILKPHEGWFTRQLRILRHEMIFARTLMDRVFQFTQSELRFNIEYDVSYNIQDSVESEKPAILIFSHFGGWDIAARKFTDKNLDKKISMIEYEHEGLSFNKVVQKKTPKGVHRIFVKPEEPLFMKLHEVLKGGGTLALMGDRPVDQNIELLPFMGKLAPIPMTPFRLAKLYKADLVFTNCARKDWKNYKLVTRKLVLSDEDLEPIDLARTYVQYLEKQVLENPYQWFNFYNFWSSVPTLPNGQLCTPKRYSLKEPDAPLFSHGNSSPVYLHEN